MTVYTDYGYGQVDAHKFLEQLKECQEAEKLAQKPILDYVKAK